MRAEKGETYIMRDEQDKGEVGNTRLRSVKQWVAEAGVSRSFLDRLPEALQPGVLKVGGRKFITEPALSWIKRVGR